MNCLVCKCGPTLGCYGNDGIGGAFFVCNSCFQRASILYDAVGAVGSLLGFIRLTMELPGDYTEVTSWPDHPEGIVSTLDKATFVATMLNHTYRNWQDVFDYLTNKGYKVVKQ